MTAAVGLVVLATLVWVGANRARWVADGMRVREFQTHLSPLRVRQIFGEAVVRTGWQFVGNGKPLVAERRIGRLHHQIAISIRVNT